MAQSPSWKVYDAAGIYQAACKEVEAAACLVGFYGNGATIRASHRILVWTEGEDGSAAESYDRVAKVAELRVCQRSLTKYVKHGWPVSVKAFEYAKSLGLDVSGVVVRQEA